MKKPSMNIILASVFITLLVSCMSGPWFIHRKAYNMYQEEIYKSPIQSIRTDGYYLEVDSTLSNGMKKVYLFLENGYVMTRLINTKDDQMDKDFSKQLKRPNDTIYQSLNWWSIENDSLKIEIFGDIPYDIMSSKWMEYGKIFNDSIIGIESEGNRMGIIQYKFVRCDSLIHVMNNAGYMDKKWYLDNLHEDRK
jgi:hypothetical protein